MLVWRCWKCLTVLRTLPGTFEHPAIGIVDGEVSVLGLHCACGAYNVLKPAGMQARLQEESD